jgi:hypothetical protein
LKEYYVIPPKQNAAFVAHMEDTSNPDLQPYEPQSPVVCMDERLVQLVKEIRVPLPARPGQSERFDYEYERNEKWDS